MSPAVLALVAGAVVVASKKPRKTKPHPTEVRNAMADDFKRWVATHPGPPGSGESGPVDSLSKAAKDLVTKGINAGLSQLASSFGSSTTSTTGTPSTGVGAFGAGLASAGASAAAGPVGGELAKTGANFLVSAIGDLFR